MNVKYNDDGTITIIHPEGAKVTFKKGDFNNSQKVELWEELSEKPDAMVIARMMREVGDYVIKHSEEFLTEE